MNTKIQFSTNRCVTFEEFSSNSVRLKLPSGKEFIIEYNPHEDGLVVNKPYPMTDDSAIHIKPYQTNEIIIK